MSAGIIINTEPIPFRMMRYGLDMDDVICDFTTLACKWHNDKYGTNNTPDDYKSYSLHVPWGCSEDECERRVSLFSDEFMETLPPIDGAIEGIRRLLQNGKVLVQVWLTDTKEETLKKLKRLGFAIVAQPKSGQLVIGNIVVEQLDALSKLKEVQYVTLQRTAA